MRTMAILFLFSLPGAVAAPVLKELKNNDLARIAGSWVAIGHYNGTGQENTDLSCTWTFESDGKATIFNKKGVPRLMSKFILNETTEPKSFDWIVGPRSEWYGVYELKDDTFTFYITFKGQKGKEGRNLKLKNGPDIIMYQFNRAESTK